MLHQIKHRFSGAVLFECEVPDEIASGLRTRHALERADETGADLRGAVLTGADLTGADLTGAVLTDAVIRGADLMGADLTGADLRGADLTGAVLTDAVLRGAVLTGAVLTDADLRGADLRGADLTGADITGAVLRGADLTGAVLTGADAGRRAKNEQSIESLDKVRAIIIDDRTRLEMRHWHGDNEWKARTCAEETLCGTTHCMAGWLQVCSTDPEIRAMDTLTAGVLAAPVAAKMFFRDGEAAFKWLESRQYVADIAEQERRSAERKARKAAEGQS